MTICKTFYNIRLEKGEPYQKKELLEDLQNPEQMASTYYDPKRDELYTFFNSNNEDWDTVYENFIVRFKRTNPAAPIGNSPAWEQTLYRHVFFRTAENEGSDYTYLGISIGETCRTENGVFYREFQIH